MRTRYGLSAALMLLCLAGCVAAPEPPPPVPQDRVEVPPPPPTPRVVWQPGEWRFRNGSYDWVPGHYIERRVAYHRYVPAHWNGAGTWVPGHWV